MGHGVGNQNDKEELSSSTDTSLILQVRNGNKAAFEQLYRKYWKFVYNSAYKQLDSTDHAKDITQDVFTQFWLQLTSRTSDTPILNLKSYLYVAVRNNVFKWLEKEKKYVPIPDLLSELGNQTDNADARILYEELYSAYSRIMENLPSQQRVIFQMRYQHDLSSDQIATELKLSPKTVRNQLGKALVRIKAGLLTTILVLTIY